MDDESQITLLGVIATMTFQDVNLDICSLYSDNLSDIYSEILSGSLSGILSDICSGAFYLTYILTFYPALFQTYILWHSN